jgi:tetratricopeptide (TPR) repeat protein
LRQTLRTLRDPSRRFAGVALTGIGGAGKSAVAGRAMQRLTEEGWIVAAYQGRFTLEGIIGAIGRALLSARQDLQGLAAALLNPQLDQGQRFELASGALAQQPLLLVLDDFEQNLPTGGGSFRDPDTATYLGHFVQNARKGRLLVTCRYPVPGFEAALEHVGLGPLSDAEARKLLLRLPSLREQPPAELRKILRLVGGHPRMLELLDALLRGGQGRLVHVNEKLQELLAKAGLELSAEVANLDEGLQQALLLGFRDVTLDELLAVARTEGVEKALLQVAVSNLPVSPDGLARMMAEDPAAPEDPAAAEKALERLADLSLVFRLPDGSGWVHRWTAEGLFQLSDPNAYRDRCDRAGRYRQWRVNNESHDLSDAIEAVRNHLQGQDFDAATVVAGACFEALRRFRQSAGIAALAAEILETLPLEHGRYALIADEEATAHLALGWTGRAKERYEALVDLYQRRVDVEPDRGDYQHDLSVSYTKMGDLCRSLGDGERARLSYQRSLEIFERLSKSEPDRAVYQRNLSVSYNKMGDLYRTLGDGERARVSYERALEIRERLSKSEPDRAHYQRDLALSYERMGDLYRALGDGEHARLSHQRALEIRERLSNLEPDRADYQRDLSVSYDKMGDLYGALGDGEQARESYQRALEIRERLSNLEPDRADYQRDLTLSYDKMGDLYGALGDGERARESYQRALEIIERLLKSEPNRADYQRDLSVSYHRIGNLYLTAERVDLALEAFEKDLAIAERLASSEPGRADYQVDLAVSLWTVGRLKKPHGKPELRRALSILELLQAEGRLSPVDEPKMGEIQRVLERLESEEQEV